MSSSLQSLNNDVLSHIASYVVGHIDVITGENFVFKICKSLKQSFEAMRCKTCHRLLVPLSSFCCAPEGCGLVREITELTRERQQIIQGILSKREIQEKLKHITKNDFLRARRLKYLSEFGDRLNRVREIVVQRTASWKSETAGRDQLRVVN